MRLNNSKNRPLLALLSGGLGIIVAVLLELFLGPGRVEEAFLDWRYRYMNAGLAPDPRVVVVRFDRGPTRDALAGASSATLQAEDLVAVARSILSLRPRAMLLEGLPELPAGLARDLGEMASDAPRLSLPIWTDKPLQLDSLGGLQAREESAIDERQALREVFALHAIRTDANLESMLYAMHSVRLPGVFPIRSARALHVVSLPLDADATLRRAPLVFRLQGGVYLPGPALRALWLAGLVDGVEMEAGALTLVSPERRRETVRGGEGAMRVHYYSPRAYASAGQSSDIAGFRIFSGTEVLESLTRVQNRQVFRFEELPVLPDEFEDAIVLLDLASPTLDTPVGPLPRSYVHATVLSNLLQGHHLMEVGQFWGWVLACASALIIAPLMLMGRSLATLVVLPSSIVALPPLVGALAFQYAVELPLSPHLTVAAATLSFALLSRGILSEPRNT